MKHHNIENDDCKEGLICKQEEDYYRHVTTGWPQGCKGNMAICWYHSAKRWLTGETASIEPAPIVEPLLRANVTEAVRAAKMKILQ